MFFFVYIRALDIHTLKNQIKSFFNFNKSQERGAFVLIVLIILAFGVNILIPIISKEETYDFSSTLAEIEAWKVSAVEIAPKKSFNKKFESKKRKKKEAIKLTPIVFNPNKLARKKWLEMGLPKSIVNIILNYEAKGGSFKKREDLQKIYGLTPEMYTQLKDFVLIPEIEISKEILPSKSVLVPEESKTIALLDINRADSVELLQVPGIGPFYAGQIVEYRKRLGGYNSVEQLNELYKMDSSRLHAFLLYLVFKDTTLNQININTVDFKTILKHPYIDYETAKKLLNHRNKLGRYAGLYQLQKDSILSPSLFQKLVPYLKTD